MGPKPKPAKPTKAKARTSAAPKAKPKPKPAATPKTKKSDSPPPPRQRPFIDKSLVLRILIAKLEATKTCDWHELSLKLNAEGDVSEADKGKADKGKAPKGGKAGKAGNGKKEKKGISGNDLHDLYHNQILPGLKSGRALWTEDAKTIPVVTSSQLIAEEVDILAFANEIVDKTTKKTGTRMTKSTTKKDIQKDVEYLSDEGEVEYEEEGDDELGADIEEDYSAATRAIISAGTSNTDSPNALDHEPDDSALFEPDGESEDDSGTSIDSDYDL